MFTVRANKQAKIDGLKHKARRQYEAWQSRADSMSCGHALNNHISGGRLDALAREFNATMDKLAELDPDCPAARLSISDEGGGL